VLANRLSADGSNRVLLLKRAATTGRSRSPSQFFSNLMIHIPVGYAQT